MSWLTGGPAMAKDGALADACRAQSRDVTSHDVTGRDLSGGVTTLPAAGVLSIADAAGAAAGQGHNSLPTGPAVLTRTIPGPTALPAVPGPRALPGTMPGAASGAAAGAAPSVAKAAPAAPRTTTALPAPAGVKTLPADATTLSAPAKAISTPVQNAVAGATAVSEPRRAPAAPAADARTLFPARSTVPLLATAPAKPGTANACAPQALRTAPAAQERKHPEAQGHQKKSHRNPKPQDQPAGSASRGDSAQGSVPQNPGAQNPGVQNPGARNPEARNPGARNPEARNPEARNPGAPNQGAQGSLASQGESHSHSSQSGASGQEQSTKTFPVKDRRHRKAHHPRKQPGAMAPGQAANQSAGQAGRPLTGTRNASLPEGERKKGAKDKRQRNDGASGQGTAMGVLPDAADGRHVPRLREYPKAASHRQNGDITAPAALTKATGTRAVTDFAAAAGKKLLP
ncbi:hypothetical protein [Microbispora bryophytorum]|uniref:Uncharacterized protein n=1 Tax=Microbispora bryophytorum TaxID=1460882 RepID=A0A8H9LB20_9ACTN|nr:hypothetical protein [Microbispora bryophytorum]MBD3135616.1 hypothetical protein [Microbispora bryophytorum]GGN98551.1 hypothetical protein GCM10011574_03280 [Microbispora bryophytorum]